MLDVDDRRALVRVGERLEHGHVLVDCEAEGGEVLGAVPQAEEVLKLPGAVGLPQAAPVEERLEVLADSLARIEGVLA